MALKFLDKPQVNYGSDGSKYNWRGRFPEGAQGMQTAPQNSATPVVVYEGNGQGHWALHYQNAWRKVSPFKDWRSGAVSWRMDGIMISNPVAWSLPRKK